MTPKEELQLLRDNTDELGKAVDSFIYYSEVRTSSSAGLDAAARRHAIARAELILAQLRNLRGGEK